jgi:hypothetical protein
VPRSHQIIYPGITYLPHTITYEENLNYCTESRCILELLQEDASSPTYRTWEAITLNKLLLTNNISIKSNKIYNKKFISVFHDENDIDWAFIHTSVPFAKGNPYQESIKPDSLLCFIEKELDIVLNR